MLEVPYPYFCRENKLMDILKKPDKKSRETIENSRLLKVKYDKIDWWNTLSSVTSSS